MKKKHTPPSETSAESRRAFLRKSGAVAVAAMCPLCGVSHSASASTSAALRGGMSPAAVSITTAPTNAGKFFPSSRNPESVRTRLASRLFGEYWTRDDEMDDYIANLAKRISKKDDFLVVPVNHDTVNAFAHFGGVIGMMGGLWLYCENEGEFAAILAHEMAHVKQEHFKRREEQSKETTALLIPLILGGLLVDDEEAREALTIGGLGILGSVITGYTREMEQEADAIAVGLLRKGGFNPRALADVLGRFQGGGGISEYISTHPAPGRRSADVIARAKPDDPNAREEVDFYFLREKLRAGFNPGNKTKRLRVAELKAGRADANALRYAILILSGHSRDAELGAEMSAGLAGMAERSAVVARAVAENMASRGEAAAALDLLAGWRERAPDNAALLGETMRILSRAKHNREALELYDDASEVLRNRASLTRRAAKAAASLGDAKRANILLTRAALRDGEFEQALRQMKVAEREAGSDAQVLLEIGQMRKSAKKELSSLPRKE